MLSRKGTILRPMTIWLEHFVSERMLSRSSNNATKNSITQLSTLFLVYSCRLLNNNFIDIQKTNNPYKCKKQQVLECGIEFIAASHLVETLYRQTNCIEVAFFCAHRLHQYFVYLVRFIN